MTSRERVAALALALALAPACGGNMVTGTLEPVPPVHRMPPELDGHTVLVAEDATIDSRDPVHIARAKEHRVPANVREAMERALRLAGFRVVTAKDAPHEIEAKLVLHVDEDTGKVRQLYRCLVRAPDGAAVADVEWPWPEGTYVDAGELYEYAAHNLANRVVLSPEVLAYLRAHPPASASP